MARPAARRPQLGPALRRIVRDAAAKLPEFSHVRASQILIVAGEARRASRATIRPLGDRAQRPEVWFRGTRILYVVTLRPRFFRDSTPEARVATLLHELYHISGRFDGTLHRGRRHAVLGPRFARRLRPIVHRYVEQMAPELLAGVAHHGEVLVRQWLEKPPHVTGRGRGLVRRHYDEAQLFLGPVRMITRRPRRA